MRPARGLLLVRPIEPAETYAGGSIIVPEMARQRLTVNQCECVAVGAPNVCEAEETCRWEYLGPHFHDFPCSVGDWLLVQPRSYFETGEPESKLWLVRQRDVLGIFRD